MFKYKNLNTHIEFEGFANNEKEKIKTNITDFLNSDNSTYIHKFSILTKILANEGKEIFYDYNLFKYINEAFFIFKKIKAENSAKFMYNFAYHLIFVII